MKDNKDAIKKIHRLMEATSALPVTLNETINFDDEYSEFDEVEAPEFEDGDNADDSNTAMNKEEETPVVAQNDVVSKIRKMALEGMTALAETPNNPDYETLKKIWQFCDKKVSETNKPAENINVE